MEVSPWDLSEKEGNDFESSLSNWSDGLDFYLAQNQELADEAGIDTLLRVFENILELNDNTICLSDAILITHFSEAAL